MPNIKISSEQILQTAARQFLLQGYHQTTVRSIAQELHISHGSIFNCFASKADIGLEIVSQFFHAWIQAVDEELQKENNPLPLDHFAFMGVVNFCFMEQNKPLCLFIRDFLMQHHAMFLEAEHHYLSDFVTAHAQNYEQTHLQKKMDVLLLDVAIAHLYSLLLEENASLRDAGIYVTRLVNFLWQLEYNDAAITQSVDRILSDMITVNKAIQRIYEIFPINDQNSED